MKIHRSPLITSHGESKGHCHDSAYLASLRRPRGFTIPRLLLLPLLLLLFPALLCLACWYRYSETGDIDAVKALIADIGQFETPEERWHRREEHVGTDHSHGNAVEVLKARRASVGFNSIEADLFERAADDFFQVSGSESVQFTPHTIADLKDVIKTLAR